MLDNPRDLVCVSSAAVSIDALSHAASLSERARVPMGSGRQPARRAKAEKRLQGRGEDPPSTEASQQRTQ